MQEIVREKPLEKVYYAYYSAPFGTFLLITYQDQVCGLYFAEDLNLARQDLNFLHAEQKKVLSLDAILNREAPLCLVGSPFDLKVWRALLTIEKGELISYRELAERAGHPKAYRAVGSAIGRNPISYLIPCHRVIRADRSLGGYRFGLSQKKKLIEYEVALLHSACSSGAG